MQLEFLGAVEQRTKLVQQFVLAVARCPQMTQRAGAHQVRAERACPEHAQRDGEDRRRQHAEVCETTDDHGALHRNGGQVHEEHDDAVEILGQRAHRASGAAPLQIAERRGGNASDRLHAQVRLHALPEIHEQRLRADARHEHQRREQHEARAQMHQLCARRLQRLIDECHERRVREAARETREQRDRQQPA